jgi:hypothetical protein
LVVVAAVGVFALVGGTGFASNAVGLHQYPGQYGYGKTKVWICHKGKKTIRVGAPAVQAHLRHGDVVGMTCAQVRAAKAHAKAHAKANAKAKEQDGKSRGNGKSSGQTAGGSGDHGNGKSSGQTAGGSGDHGNGKGKGKN